VINTADLWNDVHFGRRLESRKRRGDAYVEFLAARDEAEQRGLTLKQCSMDHYQLTNGSWLLNLYPGNQRIYADRNRSKPPFLNVPEPWTLMDCVRASANAEETT
jgi:hypothetical protein